MSWVKPPADPPFVPQTEPLWVGILHTGSAVSGRVVGWEMDRHPAPFPGSDLPAAKGTRGRAVVLVHGCSDESGFGPTVTIDANWSARYVATAEDAWRAALELEAEFERQRRAWSERQLAEWNAAQAAEPAEAAK